MTKAVQCKSCPWRVDCDPDSDIPNGYSRDLHANLSCTIAKSAEESMPRDDLRAMACHYSKPGNEFACAGWLNNQLGPGNNIAIRLGVMTGRLPVPKVIGPQHETFEDTLPTGARHDRAVQRDRRVRRAVDTKPDRARPRRTRSSR